MIHSCFTMGSDDTIFLFDYPGPRFSSPTIKNLVRSRLKDKKAFVFASHSHGDHFSTEIFEFDKITSETYFVLSDDIRVREKEHTLDLMYVCPDDKIDIDGVEIKTFKSNDAGVAFLIRYRNKYIYFGGDLARWDWPEWSEEKRKEHTKVFDETLTMLEDLEIDLAFSNMDKRLSSWAGPVQFIETVEPKYFVPMHTFGNEIWIEDLLKEDLPSNTTIFYYERPGDSIHIDI